MLDQKNESLSFSSQRSSCFFTLSLSKVSDFYCAWQPFKGPSLTLTHTHTCTHSHTLAHTNPHTHTRTRCFKWILKPRHQPVAFLLVQTNSVYLLLIAFISGLMPKKQKAAESLQIRRFFTNLGFLTTMPSSW